MSDVLIKPTIGRDVLYNDGVSNQRCTAKICYVHSDNCINIGGFDQNGNTFSVCSVTLLQEEGLECFPYTAEWMPWQIEQAKKQSAEAALIPYAGEGGGKDYAVDEVSGD